jgi:hypothetical protein
MNTQTVKTLNAIELLKKFAFQRPGLDFNDYGERKYYMQDSREITKDLHDFCELLNLCTFYIDNLNDKLNDILLTSSGRLTLNGDKLQYITGQYFPTEYRPACSHLLKNLLWRYFATKYETGQEIKKAIKKITSRRLYNNYFN